ncbi:MAG: hypothetical protein HKN29_06050 [Rhodothermales bacterium]|nr:hypothetical protein [Rhodothermales bacterium]
MSSTSSDRSWLEQRVRDLLTTRPIGQPAPPEDEGPRGTMITLCILASVLLWFSFSMRETHQRMLDIPLEVQNLSDSEALVLEPPSSARVQVEGEGIQLLRLYYNPPSIPVDASVENLDLTTVASEAITGVRVEAIVPRTVAIRKEPRLRKRVPVEPRVSVVPPPGHHVVGSAAVRPDSVTVEGAASVIAAIGRWPTRRLQVQPQGDTVSVMVALSDTLGGLVELDASSVTYSASVREFTEATRDVEIRVLGAPARQDIKFDRPTVRVIYQVALDQYDEALEAEDFYAEVHFNAMRRDTTGNIVPAVHYPEGILFREYRLDPPALGYYFEVID